VSGIRKDAGLIQIDAAISRGSSGGVVVNTRAEVIGIAVSSRVGGQNLNFAIPVEYLSDLEFHFTAPVIWAGALSLKDRDREKLEGPVQSVSAKEARYRYDQRSDKYYETLAELKEKSKYDPIGNEVEWSVYKNGNLQWRYIFTYDQQGFKTHQVKESGDGTRKQDDITPTEGINQKLNLRKFSMIAESDSAKFVYDRDGNEIEYISKTDGERAVSTYNEHGFLTERKWYMNDKLESVDRYEYETDEYGNWIKQYETNYSEKYRELGFTPSRLVYRDITYYRQ